VNQGGSFHASGFSPCSSSCRHTTWQNACSTRWPRSPNRPPPLATKAQATVGQRAVILELIAKEDALRRKEESEIADLRTKLERNKKKLDMTTTTTSFEALEHEAAFVRSEITRLEDQELESMERGEALDAPTGPRQRRRRRRCRHLGARARPRSETIARDRA